MLGDFSEGKQKVGIANFQKVVGSIVVLFDNLSPAELGLLLYPESSGSRCEVEGIMGPLYALFDMPLLFKHTGIAAIRFMPAIQNQHNL
jgi:hypothetical protein